MSENSFPGKIGKESKKSGNDSDFSGLGSDISMSSLAGSMAVLEGLGLRSCTRKKNLFDSFEKQSRSITNCRRGVSMFR